MYHNELMKISLNPKGWPAGVDLGFPKGRRRGRGQPIIRPNVPENCMKMKKI